MSVYGHNTILVLKSNSVCHVKNALRKWAIRSRLGNRRKDEHTNYFTLINEIKIREKALVCAIVLNLLSGL
jgi:hypothetical protein